MIDRTENVSLPQGHPPVHVGKVGVLLINLGTPEATSYWPMRRYLKEFLSDRRVIEVNRVLWWLILNGIILTTRPKKSGHAYEQIWNRDLNESPLKTITRGQAEKLAARVSDLPNVVVDWGMRYGLPATGDRIKAMYPEWQAWAAEAAKADPEGLLITDIVRRLQLREVQQ